MNAQTHVNDQNPILYERKIASSDLRPITLKKSKHGISLIFIKDLNYRIKPTFKLIFL